MLETIREESASLKNKDPDYELYFPKMTALLRRLDFPKEGSDHETRMKELYRRRIDEIINDKVRKSKNPWRLFGTGWIEPEKIIDELFDEGVRIFEEVPKSNVLLRIVLYRLEKERYVIPILIEEDKKLREKKYKATPERAKKRLIKEVKSCLDELDEFETSLRGDRYYCGKEIPYKGCESCLGFSADELLKLANNGYKCKMEEKLMMLMPESKKPIYLCDELRFELYKELKILTKP